MIRVDLHCCSEMASTDLIGYIIGFANDTNWAGFRHLRVLEVKTDMFLGMKEAQKNHRERLSLKTSKWKFTTTLQDSRTELVYKLWLIGQSEPVVEMCARVLGY